MNGGAHLYPEWDWTANQIKIENPQSGGDMRIGRESNCFSPSMKVGGVSRGVVNF